MNFCWIVFFLIYQTKAQSDYENTSELSFIDRIGRIEEQLRNITANNDCAEHCVGREEFDEFFVNITTQIQENMDELKQILKVHVIQNPSGLTDFEKEKEEHDHSRQTNKDCSCKPAKSTKNPTQKFQWKQNGITIVGGNGKGNERNQLDYPLGMFIDTKKTIFIADCLNDRVVQWKFDEIKGQIIAGGNGQGYRINQLKCPTNIVVNQETDSLIICDRENRRIVQWSMKNVTDPKILITNIDCYGITMDKDKSIYVSDSVKHEIKRWKQGDKQGFVIAGGNESGNHLNQFHLPGFMFINVEKSIYISDELNHRIMKWNKNAKEGIIVAGGNGNGEKLNQLSNPQGIVVDNFGDIYIADRGNHRIMRWCKNCSEGEIIVGGNRRGNREDQLFYPTGLIFDQQRNLYVVDNGNDRVQKFEINEN